MIKGVNRQIIEVTDTGNCYFERALLVVRPNCADLESDRLHEEARRLVTAAGGYAGLRRNKRRSNRRALLLAAACGLGGMLLGLLGTLLMH